MPAVFVFDYIAIFAGGPDTSHLNDLDTRASGFHGVGDKTLRVIV